MRVFVVIMHRWGDSESHTYLQGVFRTLDKAKLIGALSYAYRGGKYEPYIEEVDLSEHNDMDLAFKESLGLEDDEFNIRDYNHLFNKHTIKLWGSP